MKHCVWCNSLAKLDQTSTCARCAPCVETLKFTRSEAIMGAIVAVGILLGFGIFMWQWLLL